MEVAIIAARALNNVIGKGLDIPWRVKGEQRLFRDITMGGTLIMGRKTYDSIGRPLPGRTTIVVSRNSALSIEGCLTATSLQVAIDRALEEQKNVFIAGGGEIYQQAMASGLVSSIHLTTIQAEFDGDIFFPEFDTTRFEIVDERRFTSNIDYLYQHYRCPEQAKPSH